jgi:hypothetical protein
LYPPDTKKTLCYNEIDPCAQNIDTIIDSILITIQKHVIEV